MVSVTLTPTNYQHLPTLSALSRFSGMGRWFWVDFCCMTTFLGVGFLYQTEAVSRNSILGRTPPSSHEFIYLYRLWLLFEKALAESQLVSPAQLCDFLSFLLTLKVFTCIRSAPPTSRRKSGRPSALIYLSIGLV